jgi:16S rRNA (cytosine967-C5)-methyltransferase
MAKPLRPKKRRTHAGRDTRLQNDLVGLWRQLASSPNVPALDRWLSRELRALNGLRREQRLWLGDLLIDAVRFGALTVFCEEWRTAPVSAYIEPTERMQGWDDMSGPELWERLRQLPVGVVFYWTFMRKRIEGAELPPVAAPDNRAGEIWRKVKDSGPISSDPAWRALWSGLPPRLVSPLVERADNSGWSSGLLGRFCDRHSTRPPLWLRLLDLDHRDDVEDELLAADLHVWSDDEALAVRGSFGIYELECYREGLVEIQDRASQAIGEAVDVEPGHRVWDCCAGAGGKTLQMAADLAGEGMVLATDVHTGRLKDLQKRVKRAGLAEVQIDRWDGREAPELAPKIIRKGQFNRVLVDAPCSGSGTWRRHPDGKLRFEAEQLVELTALQLDLLKRAAAAVRPGGNLVYATCSWFVEENEGVVARFLEEVPRYELVSTAMHGQPDIDSDTTFVAVLQRAGE